MMLPLFIFVCPLFCGMVSAEEAAPLSLLYEAHIDQPRTAYEVALVEHVRLSVQKALRLESKLNREFIVDQEVKNWHVDIPYYHLLNNICEWKRASHLHVGLLKGGSFIAALYGNQEDGKKHIGVDWFHEYPQQQFYRNCDKYLDRSRYSIINASCFDLDRALFTAPIDILLYDADHSLMAHEKAFTYYNDLFADVFVAIVDDWKCPWVRRPTFKAFEKLSYTLLFEAVVPDGPELGHGQYVVVIRKRAMRPLASIALPEKIEDFTTDF